MDFKLKLPDGETPGGDLPDADVVGMAAAELPTNPTAMRRGFRKLDRNQFTGFEEFPDSGQPSNWPNGYERI